MKITVIGTGNMGGALVRGWANAALEQECELKLTATARTSARLDKLAEAYPEVDVTTDNAAAVQGADIVVVAVKPWLVEGVLDSLADSIAKDCLVVSVAAGANHPRIDIYTMPNIAVEFGEGMTFVLDDGKVSEANLIAVHDLFAMLGKVMLVDKKQMDAGNMLAGCGIAYVMRMVRAMMEGGVELGLYPDAAKEIAVQAMQGAVAVLEATGLHPEAAIDKVTTAGGLTIKGLNELDHAGFNSAVIRCLKAGFK